MASAWNGKCDRCVDADELKRLAAEARRQQPVDRAEDERPADCAKLPPGEVISSDSIDSAIRSGEKPAGRYVFAETLRHCCVNFDGRADPRGLYLENVTVLGELDLDGVEVKFPVRFEQCTFQGLAKFQGARLSSLKLTGCCVPGLMANGIVLDRELDLSGSHFTVAHSTDASMSRKATVWLCDARIGGRLHCVDTWIDARHAAGEAPSDPPAALKNCSLFADRIHVGGPVRLLHRFIAIGQIRLIGAHMNGSLDLTGAELRPSQGLAMDLEDAQIDGSVFIVEYPEHEADNPEHKDCAQATHKECQPKITIPSNHPHWRPPAAETPRNETQGDS
jgi:hypothetical protein